MSLPEPTIPDACPRCGEDWGPRDIDDSDGPTFDKICQSKCGMELQPFYNGDYELTLRIGKYIVSWFPKFGNDRALATIYTTYKGNLSKEIPGIDCAIDFTITEDEIILYELFQ
jgi:hypothetical protein